MFGENHGYVFENNKLVYKGAEQKEMSNSLKLVQKYFNETLVNSKTPITVRANTDELAVKNGKNSGEILRPKKGGAASYEIEGYNVKDGKNRLVPMIIESMPYRIEILIPCEATKEGTDVATEKGVANITPEMVLFHEFGHGMIYIILKEFGGKFNNVDFNKLNNNEKKDWTIRLSNTVNEEKGNPQETGEGQHGRKEDETPKEIVKPISE